MPWFTSSCFGRNRVENKIAHEAERKAKAQSQEAVLKGRSVTVQTTNVPSKEQMEKRGV